MVTTLEYNRSIVNERYSTKKRLFNYLKEQGVIKKRASYKKFKGTKKDLNIMLAAYQADTI